MDSHVLHNIIHQASGNNSKECDVCNGSLAMTDKKGMMQAANKILQKKQANGLAYTEEEKELLEWAELTSKDRKNLDDSSFAYVDSKGGKHLPIPDAAHVRNALARFNQTQFDSPEDKTKAMAKIKAAAKKFGVEVGGEQKNADVKTFVNLMSFAEKGNLPTQIKVLPTGTFKTRYGQTNITAKNVAEMVQNFNQDLRASSSTAGLPIDFEHGDTQYKDAAAGWIKKLTPKADGAYADIEWTDLGKSALSSKIYKFYSPSFFLDGYVDPENGTEHTNVMTGGALCNKPVLAHSLQPLVHSENGQNTLLTGDENSSTVFIELTKTTNTMDLHEIAKKAKNERTSDEQKYLTEHQNDLTFAEAKAEGLTADKAENKLAEGQIAVDEKRFKELEAKVEAGAKAERKFAELEMKDKITALVQNSEGIAMPAAQIETAVELAMSMDEKSREKYFEQLKSLPKQKVFEEKGDDKAVNFSENPKVALAQLTNVKLAEAKKNKEELSYMEAEKAVMAENPELRNLIAAAYQGGN